MTAGPAKSVPALVRIKGWSCLRGLNHIRICRSGYSWSDEGGGPFERVVRSWRSTVLSNWVYPKFASKFVINECVTSGVHCHMRYSCMFARLMRRAVMTNDTAGAVTYRAYCTVSTGDLLDGSIISWVIAEVAIILTQWCMWRTDTQPARRGERKSIGPSGLGDYT